MKYKISFLLTLLLLLASCQQEQPSIAATSTGKGHISFTIDPMASGDGGIDVGFKSVYTRVGEVTSIVENKITRMDVVIFSGGKYVDVLSLPSVDINNFSQPFPSSTYSKNCNIYFIANLPTTPNFSSYSEDTFKLCTSGLAFSSVNTIAQINANGIPMCGSLLNYNIPANGKLTGASVNLVRLLARVNIIYTTSVPVKFTATSLQLCNVPNIVPYYSDLTTVPNTYYNGMTVSNLTAQSNPVSGTTYTYYVPANRRGSDSNTDPRLKLGKDITTPTYVKIISSTACFTLYLGGNDFNDYNILANTQYTINANIKGLSTKETRLVTFEPESNCYIVKPGSTIYIPVSRAVAGNAAAGYVAAGSATVFKDGDPFVTSLLWSDVSTTHVTPTVSGDYIKVVAGDTEGNSVICAKKDDNTSEVFWSWHIWVTNYMPGTAPSPSNVPNKLLSVPGGTLPYYNNKYWLDRNIGATTSTSNTPTTLGFYYQWGRKDPFPPSSTTTDITSGKTIYLPKAITYGAGMLPLSSDPNIYFIKVTAPISVANASRFSIQYPLLFIGTGWAGSLARAAAGNNAAGGLGSWGTTNKSLFDPCPVGWRVPDNASWEELYLKASKTYDSVYSTWDNNGMVVRPAISVSYYPAMGSRVSTTGKLADVGDVGSYWSKYVYNGACYGLGFAALNIDGQANLNAPSNGCPVRCIQE